ncbi:hypothetical protein MUY14_08725 [Amycolatopsis sp. FBCC-B4732]|uniref:hypothetical protein n=1 Tax=Amycolatopsis sp. FBCC-B4732 TaxID=3079339 RepID=UPI001FF64DB3|nr:hypothetical protein [Amycolatopsis sp. FBCC-B4732]UOX90692.1 hypothetical protein MUY14_08725 [Amycolatopsis sp. FBCC-B4732]
MTTDNTPEEVPRHNDDDLQEIEFSALEPDDAAALENRVYLLGVHADGPRGL